MFKISNNSRVLVVKTNKKNGVSNKSMKVCISNLLSIFVLIVFFSTFLSSCNKYDEQDATIIAYLRINDLLENKLTKTSRTEIQQLQKNYKDYNSALLAGSFFGVNVNVSFNYDTDVIKAFNKKYTASDGKSLNLVQIETDIVSELWNYLNLTYSDVIPQKAQNVEEGRYYTIVELKEKYPDYKEVEIEGFSPMKLVNAVMNEKLFDWSMISEGDVNLRTLYVYYLANKPTETRKKLTTEFDFLKEYKDKYPSEVKLLNNTIFHNRLKRLLADRCEFLINNFEVQTPIEIKDGFFVAKACQAHNCGPTGTEFIIVYDFSNDIMSAGVEEEGKVKTYSENDETPLLINEWIENY